MTATVGGDAAADWSSKGRREAGSSEPDRANLHRVAEFSFFRVWWANQDGLAEFPRSLRSCPVPRTPRIC